MLLLCYMFIDYCKNTDDWKKGFKVLLESCAEKVCLTNEEDNVEPSRREDDERQYLLTQKI